MTRRRPLVAAAVVAAAAIAGVGYAVSRAGNDAADWVDARRANLVLEVEFSGVLQADNSVRVGPPGVPRIWRYKINELAEEGTEVAAGDKVMVFDTSELTRKLTQKQAEMEGAAKEIEKEESSWEVSRREMELELEEARAGRRKLTLKLDVPAELDRSRERAKLELDAELAGVQIEHIGRRMKSRGEAAAARLAYYRGRRDHAEGRVRELQEAIERMVVAAPTAGIVVHVRDDEGQKKKIGDMAWVGDTVVEIPDLNAMHGEGEVTEAESGRVRVGNPVRIYLDAYPDTEFAGRLDSIYELVKRQSAEVPLKVVRVDFTLAESDPQRMRPGMRFRGLKIEIDRVGGALQLPAEAVFPTDEGPVVYKRSLGGAVRSAITIGRRSKDYVEVLSGVEEGDEVSVVEPERAQ